MNVNPSMLTMRITGNDDLIPLSNLDAEEVVRNLQYHIMHEAFAKEGIKI